MSIALVTSRLRVEEKLILSELERRGVPFDHVDDGALVVRLEQRAIESDLVWNRSLSFGRALYLSRALEAQGVRVLNRASVVATCACIP